MTTLYAQNYTQLVKIIAPDRAESDHFGYSVSIYENYAAIGAFFEDEDETGGNTISSSGSVYIFKKNEGKLRAT